MCNAHPPFNDDPEVKRQQLMVTDEYDRAALRLVPVRDFGQARHADAVLARREEHRTQASGKRKGRNEMREKDHVDVRGRGGMVESPHHQSTGKTARPNDICT